MIAKVWLFIAVVFAITSGLIWFAFLRSVPVQITTGLIKSKTHKPANTYWQQPAGINRGFRTPTPISIAESYVLELYSEELGVSGYFAISPSDAGKYQIGQKLGMEYQRRGLPLIGYKITVLAVRPM